MKYIDADALIEEIKDTDKIITHDTYTGDGMHRAYANVIATINRMPTENVELGRKWIPCSERLPEDGKRVLVYWERLDRKTNTVYGFIDILYRTSERGWYCDGRGELNWDAIAWMPLPEPPKMDGGSKE